MRYGYSLYDFFQLICIPEFFIIIRWGKTGAQILWLIKTILRTIGKVGGGPPQLHRYPLKYKYKKVGFLSEFLLYELPH